MYLKAHRFLRGGFSAEKALEMAGLSVTVADADIVIFIDETLNQAQIEKNKNKS